MAGRGRGRGDPFKRVLELQAAQQQQQSQEPRSPGLSQLQQPEPEQEPGQFSPPRGDEDERPSLGPRRPVGRGRGFFPSAAAASGISSSFTQSSVRTPEIPPHLQVEEKPLLQSRGRGLIGRGGNLAEPGRGPGEARAPLQDPTPRPEHGQFVAEVVEQLAHLEAKDSRQVSPEAEDADQEAQGAAAIPPATPKSTISDPSEQYFRPDGSVASRGSSRGSRGSSVGSGAPHDRAPEVPRLPVRPAVDPVPVEIPAEPVIRKGTKGATVPILTNFLKLRVAEGKGLFQYRVLFDPVIDGVNIRRKAIKQLEETLGKTRSYDGDHLFLPFRLENDIIPLETFHPSEPSTDLIVQLEYIKQLDIQHSIYHYNVLFRRAMDELKYVEMSHKYFDPSRMVNMPEHKLEIWPGFTTAVQEYEGGLQLCLDSASRILRQTTLYEYMLATRHEANFKAKFMEYCVGKTVLTRYNNRTYKVDDVGWDMNPTHTFTRKGRMGAPDREVTYVEYFQEHYGITILDAKQPLICSMVKARKNDPLGEDRMVMLIPETCYVTGMTEEITSNNTIMRSIMSMTALSPVQRLESMKRFYNSLNENQAVKEMFSLWGLEICGRNTKVDGRVMPGPTLYFSERFSIKNATGDFSRDATSRACFKPIPIKNWIIFCTQQDKDKATRLLQTYRQISNPLGINIQKDADLVIVRPSTSRFPGPNDYKNALRERARPADVQFVIVVLPQARDDLYAAVKKQCLVETSIPSQVILAKTLMNEKRLRSVMQKVALQINAKLGGALWALNIPLPDKIMFVGIDTHHDPKRKNRSVLAMVATLDTRCTEYYSRVVFQAPHQESADALKSVYTQGLAAYFEENHDWPDRVVIFRDGISDGQLDTIKGHEVVQLKETTMSLCKRAVKFSYVVVQKRINERIFALNNNHPENPGPGTIVDHTITRRFLYDFFLVSQLVRQGTVTPSHFIVLEDCGENNPDLMQRFAFVLAFMYFNWPGTIRGPAMCQYAHKLAMLVGQHLNAEPLGEMEKKLYYL